MNSAFAHTAITCEAGKEWAATVLLPNGEAAPSGLRCLACRDICWATAPAFGDWEEMVSTKRADPEAANDIKEAMQTHETGSKHFHEGSVTTAQKYGYRVKRMASAASAAEFKSFFKKPPKGPLVKSIPTMEVGPPNAKEKVWLLTTVRTCRSVRSSSTRTSTRSRQWFGCLLTGTSLLAKQSGLWRSCAKSVRPQCKRP